MIENISVTGTPTAIRAGSGYETDNLLSLSQKMVGRKQRGSPMQRVLGILGVL